jgi:hypothetical protein
MKFDLDSEASDHYVNRIFKNALKDGYLEDALQQLTQKMDKAQRDLQSSDTLSQMSATIRLKRYEIWQHLLLTVANFVRNKGVSDIQQLRNMVNQYYLDLKPKPATPWFRSRSVEHESRPLSTTPVNTPPPIRQPREPPRAPENLLTQYPTLPSVNLATTDPTKTISNTNSEYEAALL